MYKSILLASDGSAHAERAGKEAVKLASMNDGQVTLVYVNNRSNEGDLNEEIAKVKTRIEVTENDLKAGKVRYHIEVLSGEPASSIVNYVNKHPFDILVIGSRGLNDFQGMVLGSVSHKVAKQASCPVLVIK